MDPVSKNETLQSPVKPSTDKTKYKSLKLENGLKVLLVSDTSYDLSILDKEARLESVERHKSSSYGDNNAAHDFKKRLERFISIEDRVLDANGHNIEPSKSFDRTQSVQDVIQPRSDGTCKVPVVEGDKIHFGRAMSVEDCYKDEKLQRKAFKTWVQKTFEIKEDTEAKENETCNSSELKQSAAALCVGVGSYSDPANLPGLAHFLEHMVFMGSEKYPDENGFDQFIQNHGGFNNAYTSGDKTTFYFNIQRDDFHDGLDRFIQFFISPLLKKDSMQREREAVDSEFHMRKESDNRKAYHILCSLAPDDHPIKKFGCGNLETLRPKDVDDDYVHKMLKDFFLRHYTATSMTLVVQSQHTIEYLESMVTSMCLGIPNNNQERETFTHFGNPYKDLSIFSRLYKIYPTQDSHDVDLNWSLPPILGEYQTKPFNYLSKIIRHKGKGSLFSFLKQKHWAIGLGASSSLSNTHSLFTISISLTEKGHSSIKNVLDAVFSYLSLLRLEIPDQRLFEEFKQILELDFEHGEEEESIDRVEALSTAMHIYPPEQCLNYWLFKKFDSSMIEGILNQLRPEGVNLFISSKEYKDVAIKVEPIYGGRYIDENIPDDWRNSWIKCLPIPEFHLPSPNIFIAQDLSLLKGPNTRHGPTDKYPKKLRRDCWGELYFKQDLTFLQPRAMAVFQICSGKKVLSAHDRICRCILETMIAQLITEDVYPAIQAYLGCSVGLENDGSVIIGIDGLNDKLPNLLETILPHILDACDKLEEGMFNELLSKIKKDYFNSMIDPGGLACDIQMSVLNQNYKTSLEFHKTCKAITFQSFKSFSRHYLDSFLFVKGLVQGNMDQEQAFLMYDNVMTQLITKTSSQFMDNDLEPEYNRMEQGEKCIRVMGMNPKDTNTVVKTYYQSTANYCLGELIPLQVALELMEEPIFNVLRTKEQLGYAVYTDLINSGGILGISITVQSPATKFTSDHIHERIEQFVKWFCEEKIKVMSDDEFNQRICTFKKAVVTADTNLGDEFYRNWNRINSKDYMFDFQEEYVRILSTCSKKDVFGSLLSTISCSPDIKKFSVEVIGNSIKAEQGAVTNEELMEADSDFSLEYFQPEDTHTAVQFIANIDSYKDGLESFPSVRLTK